MILCFSKCVDAWDLGHTWYSSHSSSKNQLFGTKNDSLSTTIDFG